MAFLQVLGHWDSRHETLKNVGLQVGQEGVIADWQNSWLMMDRVQLEKIGIV